MTNNNLDWNTSPGIGLGGELDSEHLVAGLLPMGTGETTWSSSLGGRQRQGPSCADPWNHRLALGTWIVTSLAGKKPELVREEERYQLDIVGLTSTHSTGSGTKLLERGWSLTFSGVAQGGILK